VIAVSFAAACGDTAGERDVTLRIDVDGEVAHGSGVIQIDPTDGRATMVAGIALDDGKSATLILREDSSITLYEERRGVEILFSATHVPAAIEGSIRYARVGDRVVFAFEAEDAGRTIAVEGAVTVTAVHGPPPAAVEDPYYEEPAPVAVGCESDPEPEPEPDPEYEYEDEEATGGGCGGVEGDTYEDDTYSDGGDDTTMEDWSSDDDDMDDWSSDDADSSAGCEGDTYDEMAMAKRTRSRALRGAWFFLWPVVLIGAFNRGLRRR
jgi:hypothetical protein